MRALLGVNLLVVLGLALVAAACGGNGDEEESLGPGGSPVPSPTATAARALEDRWSGPPGMTQVRVDVQNEIDRLAPAVNAGIIPTENAECVWTACAATATAVPSGLRVACGPDADHAVLLFEGTVGGWSSEQPPPETVLPPKVFDALREMIDFISAGGLQSGETAVLWYNGDVEDVTWFILQRPPVLDRVDAEISRLIEAEWFRTHSDVFYESRYHHFTGDLRVAVGPEPDTAAIIVDWPASPWPIPDPLPRPRVPAEEIAQALHELVDFILAGRLQRGETAVLWYEPDTGEVLTWVGSNPSPDLFGVPLLGPEEAGAAREIALANPHVRARLGDRDFVTREGWYWFSDDGLVERAGVAVTFYVRDGSQFVQSFLATVDLATGRVELLQLAPKPLPD